jgi:hypothetical protein
MAPLRRAATFSLAHVALPGTSMRRRFRSGRDIGPGELAEGQAPAFQDSSAHASGRLPEVPPGREDWPLAVRRLVPDPGPEGRTAMREQERSGRRDRWRVTWTARTLRGLWPDQNVVRRPSDRAEAGIIVALVVSFLAGAPLIALMAWRLTYSSAFTTLDAQHAGWRQVSAVLLKTGTRRRHHCHRSRRPARRTSLRSSRASSGRWACSAPDCSPITFLRSAGWPPGTRGGAHPTSAARRALLPGDRSRRVPRRTP